MSVTIQTGNSVTVQSGNRVTISAPGPQGPAGSASSLPADPGVDSVLFWDDSAGEDIWLGVSHGGNGSTDNDKVAIFGGNGSLTATNQLLIKSNGLTEPKLHLYNSANTQSVRVYAHTALAASYDVEFPTAQTASNGLPWLQNTNGTSSFGQLNLTTGVTGTLPIANGGRGNSSNANVAYVRTGATGGTVGNAADPFPTIDAAKAAMTAPFIFDLDDGAHTLNLTAANLATSNLYYFRGSGPGTTVTIVTTGATGSASDGESIVFGAGGQPFIIQSDLSCNVAVQAVGGDADGAGSYNGGNVSGRLHIIDSIAAVDAITPGVGSGGGSTGSVSFTDLSTFNSQISDTNAYVTSSLDSVINGAFYPNPAPSTSGNVLTSNGTTWTSAAPAASGTKTIGIYTPRDNQPPASNFATLDTRNSVAALDFDTATEESAIFVGVIPEAAVLTSGITVRITWAASTATSGDCRWGVAWMRCNTDIDSDSFDTATEATTTTSGTSGIPSVTSITCTTIDSVTAGDMYRLKIYRDTGDAADTMAGDAELLTVEVRTAN